MRSNLLKVSAILAFAVFTFSSCDKCQDCTCGAVTEEVCEDDFADKAEYDLAIDFLEAFGCSCK